MPTHVPQGRPREPAFTGVFSRTFLIALVLALFALFVGRELLRRPLHDPGAVPRVVTPRGDLAAEEETVISLFEATSPSVVHIETSRERRDFFIGTYDVPEGTGSGFLWDDAGSIVTNFHVIRTADRATVTLNDGSQYPARLVGYDADTDLAVLRIDVPGTKLVPIPVGTSADLRVGQTVLAIGNPFGLDQTLTTGVISGLERTILSISNRPIHGVVQTDAAINPGNSGGPLIDSAGRLIGVNTAIKSPTGAYAGIGFAVPVDAVNRVVPDLLRTGEVDRERAGLGVVLGRDAWAREFGLRGAVVQEVVPGSAADRAGIRPLREVSPGRYALGDVILGLDGQEISGREHLLQLLANRSVGERVRVELAREVNGSLRRLAVDVELQALPSR